MNGKRRTLLWTAAEVIGLVGLQIALSHWLVEKNAVAVIFSMGRHTPKAIRLLAALFMVIRFLVMFLLPGLLLARIGVMILKNRLEISAPSNKVDEVTP